MTRLNLCRVLAVALVLCAGMAVGFAPSVEAASCTTQTLAGIYRYQDMWVNQQNPGVTTSTTKGRIAFGGNGDLWINVTARDIDEFGVLTVQPIVGTGTYSVDSNCTAHLTLYNGDGLDVFILAKGEIFFVGDPAGGLNSYENYNGIGVHQ